MKGLFPQYDTNGHASYDGVWKEALFVFDTNVLLNLYRYQSTTREELINVLEKLAGQIWIPHHVALEFQRNRVKVISEQSKRFNEVRRVIDNAKSSLFADLEKLQLHRRHSLINPQAVTEGFEALTTQFLTELDKLQESQQKLTGEDPLKDRIESLFVDRVGGAPDAQAGIDSLYKEAEDRFKLRIPPGYQDGEKDKDGPDEHINGGIIYKRKFGDYLVWSQILSHAKSTETKSLVFVTDDNKDDWWWKIDSNGVKTLGPRPELREEARLIGGVEALLMYNPENFLKYAKEFLKAAVSDETLKEVRDISTTRSLRDSSFRELRQFAQQAEQTVFAWLATKFDGLEQNRFGFPDFIAKKDGKSVGFDVVTVSNARIAPHRFRDASYRAYYELNEGRLSEVTLIWIVGNRQDAEEVKHFLYRFRHSEMPETLRMIIGSVSDSETGELVFVPFEEFTARDIQPSNRQSGFDL